MYESLFVKFSLRRRLPFSSCVNMSHNSRSSVLVQYCKNPKSMSVLIIQSVLNSESKSTGSHRQFMSDLKLIHWFYEEKNTQNLFLSNEESIKNKIVMNLFIDTHPCNVERSEILAWGKELGVNIFFIDLGLTKSSNTERLNRNSFGDIFAESGRVIWLD